MGQTYLHKDTATSVMTPYFQAEVIGSQYATIVAHYISTFHRVRIKEAAFVVQAQPNGSRTVAFKIGGNTLGELTVPSFIFQGNVRRVGFDLTPQNVLEPGEVLMLEYSGSAVGGGIEWIVTAELVNGTVGPNLLSNGVVPYADADATASLVTPAMSIQFPYYDWAIVLARYAMVTFPARLRGVLCVTQLAIVGAATYEVSIRGTVMATIVVPDGTPAGTVMRAVIYDSADNLLAYREVIKVENTVLGTSGAADFSFHIEPA